MHPAIVTLPRETKKTRVQFSHSLARTLMQPHADMLFGTVVKTAIKSP